MAGEIARALARTNNLEGIGRLFQHISQLEKEKRERQRKEDSLKSLANQYTQAMQQLESLSSGTDPNDMRMIPNLDETRQYGTLPRQDMPAPVQNIQEGVNDIINARSISNTVDNTRRRMPERNRDIPTNAPADFMLGDILEPTERKRRASRTVDDFIVQSLMNQDLDTERFNILARQLAQKENEFQPTKFEPFNLSPGERRYLTPDKFVENPKPETPKEKVVFEKDYPEYKLIGYGTGETDDNGNPVITKWGSVKYKDLPASTGSDETKNKQAQEKYNVIMGSTFVPMEQLLNQGLMYPEDTAAQSAIFKVSDDGYYMRWNDNPDPKNKEEKIGWVKTKEKAPAGSEGKEVKRYKYGGAYVVRDKNGNPRLLFTDESLEDYAKSQVPNAPDKWSRTKKDKNNDPLGLR